MSVSFQDRFRKELSKGVGIHRALDHALKAERVKWLKQTVKDGISAGLTTEEALRRGLEVSQGKEYKNPTGSKPPVYSGVVSSGNRVTPMSEL